MERNASTAEFVSVRDMRPAGWCSPRRSSAILKEQDGG